MTGILSLWNNSTSPSRLCWEVKVPLNYHFLVALHSSFLKLSVQSIGSCFMIVLRVQFMLHRSVIKSISWRWKLVYFFKFISICMISNTNNFWKSHLWTRQDKKKTNSCRHCQLAEYSSILAYFYATSRHLAYIFDLLQLGVILIDFPLKVEVTCRLWLVGIIREHISVC